MIRILCLCFLLVASPVAADLVLDSPIVKPDIDRMRVVEFTIINEPEFPMIKMVLLLGYMAGEPAEFRLIHWEKISISNKDIMRGRDGNDIVMQDDADDMMLDLPGPYQMNPASKILLELTTGTFGGYPTMGPYVEQILKTILAY